MVCIRESFGKGWNDDAMKHLGLKSITREFKADYGSLPDFSQVNIHTYIFTQKVKSYLRTCHAILSATDEPRP